MACTESRFVLYKQMTNEIIFTIKQNDSTLPMTIDASDTFTAELFDLDTNESVAEFTETVVGSIGHIEKHDVANGQIKLVIDEELVTSLTSLKRGRADRFSTKPKYKLIIEADTVNNSKFPIKVNEVYVD